jgi:hypothetical protein
MKIVPNPKFIILSVSKFCFVWKHLFTCVLQEYSIWSLQGVLQDVLQRCLLGALQRCHPVCPLGLASTDVLPIVLHDFSMGSSKVSFRGVGQSFLRGCPPGCLFSVRGDSHYFIYISKTSFTRTAAPNERVYWICQC